MLIFSLILSLSSILSDALHFLWILSWYQSSWSLKLCFQGIQRFIVFHSCSYSLQWCWFKFKRPCFKLKCSSHCFNYPILESSIHHQALITRIISYGLLMLNIVIANGLKEMINSSQPSPLRFLESSEIVNPNLHL